MSHRMRVQPYFPEAGLVDCLMCPKGIKVLRKHIRTDHGMEPSESYRGKLSLGESYPGLFII